MDVLVFLSPQAMISLLVICILQTLNVVTKYWHRSDSIGDIIYHLYGGIMWYEFITPEAAAFWLLQLLPCGMAFAGFLGSSIDRHLSLCAYRFGSQTAWWLFKVCANIMGCFVLALLSGICCAGISFASGLHGLQVTMTDAQGFRVLSLLPVGLALLAYALQMALLTTLGMLAFLITRSSKAALLCYLLPVTWSLMQYSGDDLALSDNRHRIINWGMAKRFAQYGNFGVNIREALLGSILYIVLFTLLGVLVQLWVNQTQRRST